VEFSIADDVRQLGVRGAYVVLSNLDNTGYPSSFAAWREQLRQRLIAELTPDVVELDPILRGFRDLHAAVGRSNRRFPASAEALLALFQRKHLIPQINPAVDLYNCVSLETRLSLGAHDLAKVQGGVTLQLTDGGERFVPLGQAEPEPIQAGEYGYVDDSGEVLCRLEHRQCEKTKVTPATTACFYIIQGNRESSREVLERALRRLVELTARFCGGREERSWIAAD
jgi:DNA/RNA-binding domain of Phe-tRNA-synthetase-like protein